MDELSDAVAILLEAIEDHAGEITDPILAARVEHTRKALEELQLHLDTVTDREGASTKS